MHKLILVAALAAFAAVAVDANPMPMPIGIGLGLPHTGYGYIGGLTPIPNLGYGNIAAVNSNHNTIGYRIHNIEKGPLSIRSHHQAAITPLGVGIPVGIIG